MSKTQQQLKKELEAILFYTGEPVKKKNMAKICDVSLEEVEETLKILEEDFKDRGVVLMHGEDSVSLGTHSDTSEIIEKLAAEEISKDLGKAALETLSIILYRSPITKRELDYIRGVNSSYIIRNLLIRGLIEKSSGIGGERSFIYKPTVALLAHLGISKIEDLPNRETILKELDEFNEKSTEEDDLSSNGEGVVLKTNEE